jgi:metallo-beta-lactamase family protein
LYELEKIIFQDKSLQQKQPSMRETDIWANIDIIVDSPMASKFTEQYRNFKELWDKEAKRALKAGRHPLNFEQLTTINSHQEHMQTIEYLVKSRKFTNVKPAIVIAASGMCSGGRIVNYLKQFLSDSTADVLFVGYQAQGTLGRNIQKYAKASYPQGYVFIDGKRVELKAKVHTISGYSAHADQTGLINFVKRMRHKPTDIKIVHGDESAKKVLANKYKEMLPNTKIEIPK